MDGTQTTPPLDTQEAPPTEALTVLRRFWWVSICCVLPYLAGAAVLAAHAQAQTVFSVFCLFALPVLAGKFSALMWMHPVHPLKNSVLALIMALVGGYGVLLAFFAASIFLAGLGPMFVKTMFSCVILNAVTMLALSGVDALALRPLGALHHRTYLVLTVINIAMLPWFWYVLNRPQP